MIRYYILLFFCALTFFQRALAFPVMPQEIDITGLEVLTGLILGACGTIWVVRKLIKTVNRS
jgi:hypothetical protein